MKRIEKSILENSKVNNIEENEIYVYPPWPDMFSIGTHLVGRIPSPALCTAGCLCGRSDLPGRRRIRSVSRFCNTHTTSYADLFVFRNGLSVSLAAISFMAFCRRLGPRPLARCAPVRTILLYTTTSLRFPAWLTIPFCPIRSSRPRPLAGNQPG